MKTINEIKEDFIWIILQLCCLYDSRPSEVKEWPQVKSVQELIDKCEEFKKDFNELNKLYTDSSDKSAEVMFEELFYKRYEDDAIISYTYANDDEQKIVFYKNNKDMIKHTAKLLGVKALKAINKQLEELKY